MQAKGLDIIRFDHNLIPELARQFQPRGIPNIGGEDRETASFIRSK